MKEYLGDSVYATFDGFCVTLTTENEDDVASNTIVLEPAVIVALERFIELVGKIC
jgi:hypothetical protein